MTYWIIVAVLVILILVTAVFTIKGIRREHKERKEEALRLRSAELKRKSAEKKLHSNKGKAASAQRAPKSAEKKKSAPAEKKKPVVQNKRRWKIILEDMSTGEVYDYIFVQAVGIGRTEQDVSYEKFLALPSDRRISKVHCSIFANQDRLYLRDEGSKNHTYLNGKRVQKPMAIQKEDVISIGETDLVVVKVLREAN